MSTTYKRLKAAIDRALVRAEAAEAANEGLRKRIVELEAALKAAPPVRQQEDK